MSMASDEVASGAAVVFCLSAYKASRRTLLWEPSPVVIQLG